MVSLPPEPQLKFYYSNNDIHHSGDNMGTIFDPNGLVHTGEGFWLEAGQSVMILPLQPDHCNPWKIYKSALFDNRFVRNKTARNLCYILTNQWIYRSIYIPRGSLLAWLLGHPGIHHTMGYMSAYDLAHLKKRENVPKAEDEEDEDEEEEEGEEDNDNVNVVYSTQEQDDPFPSQLSAPRMTPGNCASRNTGCCHHVEVIRPKY